MNIRNGIGIFWGGFCRRRAVERRQGPDDLPLGRPEHRPGQHQAIDDERRELALAACQSAPAGMKPPGLARAPALAEVVSGEAHASQGSL